MASKANYQTGVTGCYILERNLTFPFSALVPFRFFPGHSELLMTGRVNTSPTEFEIILKAPERITWDNLYRSTYFDMHHRWNEDRTKFSYYIDTFYSEECYHFPQYAHFPSLKPGSDFTITISTAQVHPDKNVFHYKVRVNDDPVVMIQNVFGEIGAAEVEIKCPNNDINVTLVRLDVTE